MGAWHETLREKRIGIMLHYDASGSDKGAVSWLLNDPRCRVSYNWLITDEGAQYTVAPVDARAWHAGVCRPSNPDLPYVDANSAFYGISIAATDGETATEIQREAVVRLCVPLFKRHRWSRVNSLYRIVGHNTECWPRNRKHDPVGSNPNKPVLSVQDVRDAVRDS